MRRRYSFDRLFEGNLFTVFCVIFTIMIIQQAVVSVIVDATLDFAQSALSMAAYTSVPLITMGVPRFLVNKNYISEKVFGFFNSILSHYITSCALLMGYVFILRQLIDIPQNAYFETLIFFTFGYIAVTVGAIIICFFQTVAANKNLKKIQTLQKG